MPEPRSAERAEASRRICVVAGNDDSRDVIVEILRREGHAIDVASSGPVAIMHAAVRRPEIVVFDLGAPAPCEEDAKFIEEMRSRFQPAPAIVVLTTSPTTAAWSAPGVCMVLIKPFDLEALRLAVTLAAMTLEPDSARLGSGLRRSVRPRSILILASAPDSSELRDAIGDPLGVRFIVTSSGGDAREVLRVVMPTCFIADSTRSPRAMAEAHARGIDVRVVPR